MRDNPSHGVSILAGMFGMRRPPGDDAFSHVQSMSEVLATMLDGSRSRRRKYADQELLKKHLWPVMRGASATDGGGVVSSSVVAHDSYFCVANSKITETR